MKAGGYSARSRCRCRHGLWAARSLPRSATQAGNARTGSPSDTLSDREAHSPEPARRRVSTERDSAIPPVPQAGCVRRSCPGRMSPLGPRADRVPGNGLRPSSRCCASSGACGPVRHGAGCVLSRAQPTGRTTGKLQVLPALYIEWARPNRRRSATKPAQRARPNRRSSATKPARDRDQTGADSGPGAVENSPGKKRDQTGANREVPEQQTRWRESATKPAQWAGC